MTTVEQVKVTLPADVLADVVRVCEESGDDGIVALWLALGVDLAAEDCPMIRPADWAIPTDQWEAICSALVAYGRRMHRDDVGAISPALTMMNVGPSSF